MIRPEQASSHLFLSPIFTIPKKNGDLRLILNLKHLNHFIPKVHFKMEGVGLLPHMLMQGDWVVKLDLQEAFFAVPIHPTSQGLLSFVWQGRILSFTCLPFGLTSAPRIFTKLLKPVTAFLRERGVRLIIYIDDILVMAQSRSLAYHHLHLVVDLLELLGFIINYQKSILTPTQELIFLGLVVNSVDMSLSPGGKASEDQVRSQRSPVCHQPNIRSLTGEDGGSLQLMHSSSSASTLALQTPSGIEKRHRSRWRLQPYRFPLKWCTRGAVLVDHPSIGCERPASRLPFSRHHDLHGCFDLGLGSHFRSGGDRRSLVQPGEVIPYQLFGITCCLVRCASTSWEPDRQIHTTLDGQLDSYCLRESHGRNPFISAISIGSRDVALGLTRAMHHEGQAHCGQREHQSRRMVQGVQGQVGLETEPPAVSPDQSLVGPFGHRSLCDAPVNSSQQVL